MRRSRAKVRQSAAQRKHIIIISGVDRGGF